MSRGNLAERARQTIARGPLDSPQLILVEGSALAGTVAGSADAAPLTLGPPSLLPSDTGRPLDDLIAALEVPNADAVACGSEPPMATPTTLLPRAETVAPQVSGRTLTLAQGIALVNATYFIAPLAGESTVWREGMDYETGRRTVTPISTESLRLDLAPYTVDVPSATGARSMQLADLWLRNPQAAGVPRWRDPAARGVDAGELLQPVARIRLGARAG